MRMAKFTDWNNISHRSVIDQVLIYPIIGLFLLCLFFLPCQLSAQQDTSYQLLREMETNAIFFNSDKLLQSYLVSPKNELIKYDAQGKEAFRYNNNYLGKLKLIDATNPFNLLLYYPDYQTVITLDRTLNETGEINLFDLGIINVQAIASSNDNNVWIYDDALFKLKKMDQNGRVLVESNDLSLLLNSAPRPAQIKARENWIYINDPEMGILIFDNFAQYHKLLPFKQVDYFQIIGEQFIYSQEGILYNFNLKSLLSNNILLPQQAKQAKQLSFQKDHLFILKEGQLKVYQFK